MRAELVLFLLGPPGRHSLQGMFFPRGSLGEFSKAGHYSRVRCPFGVCRVCQRGLIPDLAAIKFFLSTPAAWWLGSVL